MVSDSLKSLTVDACDHCGLPALSRFSNDELKFCCSGCDAAYHLLRDESLLEFYNLRDQFGGSSQALAPSERRYLEFDDPSYLHTISTSLADDSLQAAFVIPNVHCAACVWVLEKLLSRDSGVLEADVNISNGRLDLRWDQRKTGLSCLARKLSSIGYPIYPAGTSDYEEQQKQQDRKLWIRLGVTGAIAGNIMLLSIPLYTGEWYGINPEFSNLFRYVSAFLATIIVGYGAYPFHRSAIGSLRAGLLHIDLPISLGITVAYTGSIAAIISGTGHVYFDSIAGLTFFLLIGRLILSRGHRKAERAARTLIAVGDPVSRLIQADGSTREILSDTIQCGDRIRLPMGATSPVDGVVISGSSFFDNAVMTGESQPVQRSRDDQVLAGTTNLSSPVDLEATQIGAERQIAKIAALLQDAASQRAPVMDFANRLAGAFTLITLIASAATGAVWLFIDPSQSLTSAVAVAVVMCPCALGLATPLALAVAQGRAAERGVMVKGADAIQRTAELEMLAFDKTGTITTGLPSILKTSGLMSLDARPIWDHLAALEQYSLHPLGRCFVVEGNQTGLNVAGVRERVGLGIEGRVNNHHLRIGSDLWLGNKAPDIWKNEDSPAPGATRVWVEADQKIVTGLWVGDIVRDDATSAIEQLHTAGIDTMIISGDSRNAVSSIAADCNIKIAFAEQNPEDKLKIIARQNTLKKTGMIGDGVNDSAALAAAHIGIAVGGSAQAALEVADIYFTTPGLNQVINLIQISQDAMSTVKRNMGISIVYNTIGLILASGGFIGPLGAALLMPASSFTVVMSSLVQGGLFQDEAK